jgi:hypothetical protein
MFEYPYSDNRRLYIKLVVDSRKMNIRAFNLPAFLQNVFNNFSRSGAAAQRRSGPYSTVGAKRK